MQEQVPFKMKKNNIVGVPSTQKKFLQTINIKQTCA